MVPWPIGSPRPFGAVVVGVSSLGDPLLAVTTESDRGKVYAGFASTRHGAAHVGLNDRSLIGPW